MSMLSYPKEAPAGAQSSDRSRHAALSLLCLSHCPRLRRLRPRPGLRRSAGACGHAACGRAIPKRQRTGGVQDLAVCWRFMDCPHAKCGAHWTMNSTGAPVSDPVRAWSVATRRAGGRRSGSGERRTVGPSKPRERGGSTGGEILPAFSPSTWRNSARNSSQTRQHAQMYLREGFAEPVLWASPTG